VKRFFFITPLLLILFMVTGLAMAEEKASTTTMTLEQALAYAEANSLQLQMAGKDLDTSKSKVKEAYGNYFPTLTAGLLHTENPSQPSNVDRSDGAEVYLTQPLFNSPIYVGYQQAQKGLEIGEIAYNQIRTELRYSIANTFFTVCKAKEGIKIAQDSLSLAEKNLRMVKANFDAGIVVKTDVLKMELNVSNARQGVLSAENSYRLTIATFKQIIGYPQNQDLEIVSPQITAEAIDTSKDVSLDTRYDVQIDKLSIESAELGVKQAKAGYLPTVFAKLDFADSYNHPDVNHSNGDGNTSLQIGLSWSFSLGGKTKAVVDQAEQAKDKSGIKLEATKQSATTEILQCQLSYTEAQKRTEITGLALKIAEENSNLAVKRYEAGVGTALEVSDAQVALEKAKNDELNARYDLFLAGIKLKKAMGLYKEMLIQGAEMK
jgi:outer membrane protein TolC